LSKTDLISTKSHGPKDQSEEVNLIPQNYFESVLNLTKPLNANNNNNNKNDNRILNDEALTKDIVIRFEKFTKNITMLIINCTCIYIFIQLIVKISIKIRLKIEMRCKWIGLFI